MRKDVKKLLFFGLEEDKSPFFQEAQVLGLIQFIDQKNRKISPSNATSDIFAHAIRILRGLEKAPQTEVLKRPLLEIAKEIVDLKKTQDKLEEESRILHLEIERIQIFGNCSLADIKYLEEHGKRFLQFFSARESFPVEDQDLIFVASQHGLNYYLSIQPQIKTYPGMNEMKIDCGLKELHDAVEKNKKEHRKIHANLASFAPYSIPLHQALADSLDSADLTFAEEGTESLFDGQIFASTGFVPEDKVATVLECARSFGIHAEEVAIEPSDKVPTYLENEDLGRIGEDLVNIYDTPSTQDKDPSLWVFFSFLVFFSIIIGDGGYGSVFLGLALYLRYKFPDLAKAKKRLLNLFTILCFGCIAWGILTTSFFGISFSPENPLRSFSLVHYLAQKKVAYHLEQKDHVLESWMQAYPATQEETNPRQFILKGFVEKEGERAHELLTNLTDQILMELALFIGGIHIFLGMGRYLRKNPSNIGWMIFLVGAYLYLPLYLGIPSMLNYVFSIPFEQGGIAGLQLIGFGIPAAVIIAVIRNGLVGLTEIMNLIQVFADALSYLRLYALGLSGTILSATINDMANVMPFLIAIFLIIIGHLVNMVLGIMGGVIHGLRLNFIEWYHYSFEGGGKPFKPLQLKSGESS
jgi:V/A-type H+/Na+-transporting ATPase subunit I